MGELDPGFKKPEAVPNGWLIARVKDVAKVVQGGRLGLTKEADYIESGTPAYSAAGQDGFVAESEYRHQSGVVLSSIGANCGRCYRAEGSWTTLANTQVILPASDSLDHGFLHHRVDDESYWLRSGSAQPFIKPSTVKDSWLALPPLEEQRRITEILDTLDETIQATERVIAKHEAIRSDLASDLLDGRLSHTRSSVWRDECIGSLVTFEYGSALAAESRKGGDYSVYGSNGVVGHHEKALVSGPGIIVGRKGTVGAVRWSESDFWPIDTTYWVRPLVELDLRWMHEVLGWVGLDSLDSSTGVPGLNRGDAYEQYVRVPPVEEQRRIAEILDTADETIRANEEQLRKLQRLRSGLADDLLSGRVWTVDR